MFKGIKALLQRRVGIKEFVIISIFSIFVIALICFFNVKNSRGYAPNLKILKQRLNIINFDLDFDTHKNIYYVYDKGINGHVLLYFYGKMEKNSITNLLKEKRFHVLESPERTIVSVVDNFPPQMLRFLGIKVIPVEKGEDSYFLESPDSNVISFNDRTYKYYINLKVSESTGSFVGIFQSPSR